jgi:iron complex outermembrane recepter protein
MNGRYLLGLLAASTAMPLMAQTAPVTPAPADTAAAAPSAATPAQSGTGIADIVVTARKTEEKLQNVPIAVTALSGAQLKQQTIQNVQDVQYHVPGFLSFPEPQGGAPDFAIRGAKQYGISGSQGGIGVYLDYIPLSSNFSIKTATYDMQNVQVLKGPQGTVFGKNTTGGAVIFTPNKPTDHFEAYLQGEYGNYNRVDLTGMVNLPITDGVALRVAGRYVHRDPYYENEDGPGGTDGENNKSLRATLRIQPNDKLTNDTMFDWYHQHEAENIGMPVAVSNAEMCGLYPADCINGVSQAYAKAINATFHRKTAFGDTPNFVAGTWWGISNTTTWQASDSFSIRNIFGYRRDREHSYEENDGSYLPILEVPDKVKNRQITDELDFIGKLFDDRLSYTAGLYYANSKADQNSDVQIFAPYPSDNIYGVYGGGGGLPQFPFQYIDPTSGNLVSVVPPSPSLQQNNFKIETKAIFGQVNYKISDELTLTVGARYNSDKDQFNSFQFKGYTDPTESERLCVIGLYSDPSELVGPCELERHKTFNAFTWNASLNFKPDPNTLIYVSAGRGFQSGGFNQQIREVQYREFNPEKVFTVEAGMKKDWHLFDRPIRTNFAIFRSAYKDQQRVENGTYPDGGQFIATFNAANSTVWGGELEIDYLPTEHIDMALAYSYVHAQYDTFNKPNIEAFVSGPDNLSGLAIAATPKHTINATIGYSVPTNDHDGKARLSVTGYYRSGTYFQDLVQDALTYQKGYALMNARLDLTKTLPVDIGIWANNITNKFYGAYKNDNIGSGLGYADIVLGPPRTFGVDVSIKF